MERSQEAVASDQFVALLIGLLNIALRPQRKAISAEIANRLYSYMRDATAGGDPIYDLLDDLLTAPPIRSERVTQQFERPSTRERENYYGAAVEDPEFAAHLERARRAEWGR